MYTTDNKDGVLAQIGKVSISIRSGSYRLRWRHLSDRYSITLGKADTKEAYKQAVAKANEINSDILMERFDTTLAKYDPKKAQKISIAEQKTKQTLRTLWECYKQAKQKSVAPTTQKSDWRKTDRCLDKLPLSALELDNSNQLLPGLLKHYSPSIVQLVLKYLNASVNKGIKDKLITGDNPYKDLKSELPLVNSTGRAKEAFEPNEIKTILQAFSTNKYVSPYSYYEHSYYYGYVSFLALTGCRPEEAIALTWNDIKVKGDRTVIVFNKAFSNGELMNHTKTYEIRTFSCNEQLLKLLNTIPKKAVENNLVFPTIEGTYINQSNFQRRYFKPIVTALYKDGKVSQVLPTYNLRHSFITRMIREGCDIGTIAGLVGTSPQMIYDHYLGVKREAFNLPAL